MNASCVAFKQCFVKNFEKIKNKHYFITKEMDYEPENMKEHCNDLIWMYLVSRAFPDAR